MSENSYNLAPNPSFLAASKPTILANEKDLIPGLDRCNVCRSCLVIETRQISKTAFDGFSGYELAKISATISCIAGSHALRRSRVAAGHGETASLKMPAYARTDSAKYSSRPHAAYGVTNARAPANAERILGSKPLRYTPPPMMR